MTLEHFEAPQPDYALERYAATYPFAYTNEEASDLVNARNRQYPDERRRAWARQFLLVGDAATGTMAMLRAMTLEIANDFQLCAAHGEGREPARPTPCATSSGSCRDFAVLMMDAVRSLGLAARFVSGYIFVPDHSTRRRAAARRTRGCRSICRVPAGSISIRPTASSATAI